MTANREPEPLRPATTDLPSLEFVLKQTQEQLKHQWDRAKALDAKANFVLGSASLITGLTALQTNALAANIHLGQSGIPHNGLGLLSVLGAVLSVLAFVAFVVVVYLAYQGYRVRTFTIAPDPENLQHYPIVPLRETQEEVLGELVRSFVVTEQQIDQKAIWITWALRVLLAEGVLLALALIAMFIRVLA
jgi:hypothetical protein